MIIGEQPHRIVPPRPREWPCGHTDGGYMFGDGNDCRAADVQIEDWVSPPLYTHRPLNKRTVESTHTRTSVVGHTEIEGRPIIYRICELWHPGGVGTTHVPGRTTPFLIAKFARTSLNYSAVAMTKTKRHI